MGCPFFIMNKTEWLKCTDPWEMIEFLEKPTHLQSCRLHRSSPAIQKSGKDNSAFTTVHPSALETDRPSFDPYQHGLAGGTP